MRCTPRTVHLAACDPDFTWVTTTSTASHSMRGAHCLHLKGVPQVKFSSLQSNSRSRRTLTARARLRPLRQRNITAKILV